MNISKYSYRQVCQDKPKKGEAAQSAASPFLGLIDRL